MGRRAWNQKWARLVVSALGAVVLLGCTDVSPMGAQEAPESQEPQESPAAFVFADDDDPALAALAFVETELLVGPYAGADPADLNELYAQSGAVVTGQILDIDVTVLSVAEGSLETVAAALMDSLLIESVHKNYLFTPDEIPDDPRYDRQPHLARAGLPEAWDRTTGARDVIIAVVDTGVDGDHPDLAGRIIDGWNAYDDDSDFYDVKGHGTLVAGVVAAEANNGVGVAGVTWANPILVVRATDDRGRASARHIAAGILWAVQHGARVINVSFAPLWSNRIVKAAAVEAFNRGSLVVISAGNGGSMTTRGGYDQAVFVGAIDAADEIASFSDRGPFVDLVAPGTGIDSTDRGGTYRAANGTSFAAPIVTGVAALCWSVNPDLRPVTIRAILTSTATDLGSPGKDSTYGHGLIDAAGAVAQASVTTFVADTDGPRLSITRPSSGDRLVGRFVVRAQATDDWGVADVVLSIDGVAIATDHRSPYAFIIDTSHYSLGDHRIELIATDHAGNSSATALRQVTFGDTSRSSSDDAPGVVFTSPAAGARVGGEVTIMADVTAPSGISTIQWQIDGQSVLVSSSSGTSSGVTYLWRSAAAAPGSHTISIIVTDKTGQTYTGSISLITQ